MTKHLNFILFMIIGIIMSLPLMGQNQGHISFEVTDAQAEDPQVQAQMEMMKGSTSDVYYLGEESLTINNMMGGMVNMKMKRKAEGMTMAFDMMGQKFLIPISKEEMEKGKSDANNPMNELDITYDEADTKEIAGFECYKMVASPVTNPEIKIEAYITEEIKTNAALIQGVDMEQFKGFPLEIVADMGPVVLTTTAKGFEAKCEASALEMDTNGYTEMTLEEFMNSMGQMGGGFGF